MQIFQTGEQVWRSLPAWPEHAEKCCHLYPGVCCPMEICKEFLWDPKKKIENHWDHKAEILQYCPCWRAVLTHPLGEGRDGTLQGLFRGLITFLFGSTSCSAFLSLPTTPCWLPHFHQHPAADLGATTVIFLPCFCDWGWRAQTCKRVPGAHGQGRAWLCPAGAVPQCFVVPTSQSPSTAAFRAR